MPATVPTFTRWERALARYRRAEARLAAFRAAIERLPPERRAFPACEPLDDGFDDLECARLDALRGLLRRPAPDLPALALKIDLIVDDQAWELTGAEPCLAALKTDARRLASGGRHSPRALGPTVDPVSRRPNSYSTKGTGEMVASVSS